MAYQLRGSIPKKPDPAAIVREAAKRALASPRVQSVFRAETASPGPVRYPVQWASDRQRRFVMAMLTQQGNLPYRRTGRALAQWAFYGEDIPSGFTWVLENTSPVAKWLYGTFDGSLPQQPMHRATGYHAAPRIRDANFDAGIGVMREIAADAGLELIFGRPK